MDIRPVQQYQQPKLPTRQIIDECPELLRLVPKRWQTNPVVLSALAGVCTLMLGTRIMAAEKAQPASQVAPVFKHGNGVGAFGCVAVNPPVFLSEDEARQIIVEEAKRSGIAFVDKGKTIPNVAVPVTSTYPGIDEEDKKKPPTQTIPLKLDGVDEKRVIAYEYVSEDDFNKWQTGQENTSTASSYNLFETAQVLRQGMLKAAPKGTYAVFYDPMLGWGDAQKKNNYKPDYTKEGEAWDAERAKLDGMTHDLAREELRKQVQDFIAWLKTQGVI